MTNQMHAESHERYTMTRPAVPAIRNDRSEVLTREARPDVAVVTGTGIVSTNVLRAAELIAHITGGDVQVIRLVDDLHSRRELGSIDLARGARTSLARCVGAYLVRHPGASITERMHHGTCESLLRTLDARNGVILIPARDPIVHLRKAHDRRTWVADETGQVSALGDGTGLGSYGYTRARFRPRT
ncbi:hypothetical protein GCM10009758_16160 [Microbacterium hatanonis]